MPPPTILLFQLNIVGRFRENVGDGAEQTDESAEKTFGELRRHDLRNSSLHMAESVVKNDVNQIIGNFLAFPRRVVYAAALIRSFGYKFRSQTARAKSC